MLRLLLRPLIDRFSATGSRVMDARKCYGSMTFSRQALINLVVLPVCVLISSSCNQRPSRPKGFPVSGSISYKGKALSAGLVTFTSASDSTLCANCILQPDGAYSMADAPIGEAKVSVDTRPALELRPGRYVQIPLKYSRVQTSGLSFTVEKGDNTNVNFNLQ